MTCRLCASKDTSQFHKGGTGEYHRCRTCGLVFLDPSQLLSADQEKERYDLHKNSPKDKRYRKFLSPVFIPVSKHLKPESSGLDFGSGPGPTLSVMFEEAGHRVALFDPFYANSPMVFKREYDFITATEVAEHLHFPGRDFKRVWSCLKRGGILAVMTKMLPADNRSFSGWYYKDDPSHVCFFSKRTFLWIADNFNSKIAFTDEGVALFFKE